MAGEPDTITRQQMLDLIVEERPVTASSITKVLGLTMAAVRHHITPLLDSGKIAEHEPSAPSKRGRGRPARHYVATEQVYAHPADGCSNLASKALGYLGQLDRHGAVESFVAAWSYKIERRHAPIVRGTGSDSWVRAQALVDASTQDDCAATMRGTGGGTLTVQLYQGHCPIQNVTGDFPQLYDVETLASGELLDVHVQRLLTLAGEGHVHTTRAPVGMPVIRPGAQNV